jgi:hypothetical protein
MAATITPPDFKLTFILGLTRQRKPIPVNVVIPPNLKYTKSVYLNVPHTKDFEDFIKSIPDGSQIVFESILGKGEFIDEVILPIYLNKSTLSTQKKIVAEQYERLLKIIEDVVKKCPVGNRRDLYKQYFYSGEIVKPIPGSSVNPRFELIPQFEHELLTDELEAFKATLGKIRVADYAPTIDLLELSVDQFRLYLKFLPSEIKWARSLMERDELFALIIMHIDNVKLKIFNYTNAQQKFNATMEDRSNRSIKELVWLVQSKSRKNTTRATINVSISKLNAFAGEYNSTKSLIYNGRRLSSSFANLEQIFNSGYINFLMTAKARYKSVLSQSIMSPKRQGSPEPMPPTPKRQRTPEPIPPTPSPTRRMSITPEPIPSTPDPDDFQHIDMPETNLFEEDVFEEAVLPEFMEDMTSQTTLCTSLNLDYTKICDIWEAPNHQESTLSAAVKFDAELILQIYSAADVTLPDIVKRFTPKQSKKPNLIYVVAEDADQLTRYIEYKIVEDYQENGEDFLPESLKAKAMKSPMYLKYKNELNNWRVIPQEHLKAQLDKLSSNLYPEDIYNQLVELMRHFSYLINKAASLVGQKNVIDKYSDEYTKVHQEYIEYSDWYEKYKNQTALYNTMELNVIDSVKKLKLQLSSLKNIAADQVDFVKKNLSDVEFQIKSRGFGDFTQIKLKIKDYTNRMNTITAQEKLTKDIKRQISDMEQEINNEKRVATGDNVNLNRILKTKISIKDSEKWLMEIEAEKIKDLKDIEILIREFNIPKVDDFAEFVVLWNTYETWKLKFDILSGKSNTEDVTNSIQSQITTLPSQLEINRRKLLSEFSGKYKKWIDIQHLKQTQYQKTADELSQERENDMKKLEQQIDAIPKFVEIMKRVNFFVIFVYIIENLDKLNPHMANRT